MMLWDCLNKVKLILNKVYQLLLDISVMIRYNVQNIKAMLNIIIQKYFTLAIKALLKNIIEYMCN